MDVKLPDGHIDVDTALKVLEKHTATKPVVDLDFMVDNIRYMNSAHNYTMKLMKKNKDGKYYSDMHVAVVVRTDRDLENLKYAIKETAKRVGYADVEPEKKVRTITTQVDDKAGSTSTARINKESKTSYGSKMEKGFKTVTEIKEA